MVPASVHHPVSLEGLVVLIGIEIVVTRDYEVLLDERMSEDRMVAFRLALLEARRSIGISDIALLSWCGFQV